MRHLVNRVLLFFIWLMLRLRYRITVKGLKTLKDPGLKKGKGTLFLPNHPSIFTDPMLVSAYTFGRFRPRALITEYMYFTPGIYTIMQWINALPIPSLTNAPNSYKVFRNRRSFETAVNGLKKGENFLIYPAGRSKSSGLEIIGGASGVHKLLKEVPEANVVLVRLTGMWGSVFSRAITGKPPAFWQTIAFGIKTALKAGLFFLPRRDITIEYVLAPEDFPREASRTELNRWLEEWYNKPYEGNLARGEKAGEPMTLVSYSPWRRVVPEITAQERTEQKVDLDRIDPGVREKVIKELSQMTKRPPEKITPELDLAQDLGLDSLDGAELIAFMEEELGVNRVQPEDLTTVEQLLGIASGQVKVTQNEVEEGRAEWEKRWRAAPPLPPMEMPEGKTIGEIFLRNCDRLGNQEAVADPRGGILTYADLKMRALLVAEEIRNMPGERIGIMLPASVTATVLVLACHLARKIPVMVNWTVGPRHLDTVVELSKIEVVLTAWAFIDRLDNAELGPIHQRIVLMEEVAFNLGLRKKVGAALRARRSADTLIRQLRLNEVNPETPAGILFTSGTEKAPKGVPLTHTNMVANLRSTMKIAPFSSADIVLSMLPPFHSFGFTLTGLLPILCGVKVVFSPDPTDGPRIAREIHRWGVTMLVGAPTFLKGILKAGSKEQLATLRSVLSGAERVSPEVVAMTKALGDHVAFIEGYGVTECSPVVTVQLLDTELAGVGPAVPEVELKIVHPDTMKELKVGERGLILIKGQNIFGGYLPSEGVSNPFVEINGHRWYNSGDLGFLDKSGNLHIAGRLKRFVKIGGEMVSLTAIEAVLLDEAPTKGWPEPEEGPTLAVCAKEEVDSKAELFLFTRFKTNAEEINGVLREQGFSNLVRISEVFVLPDIPLMGTGKTNYRALEDKYLKAKSVDGKARC